MPAWLAPALAYLPQWLDFQIAKAGLPGASLAVAHRGKTVLTHATGLASTASGEKLTTLHRFRVASHSKTFTAAAVLKLVEAGRLRLDDRIGQHIAGLHKAVARATIGQLLSHTGGIIRDGEDAGQWAHRRPFLAEAELRTALAAPPTLPPNTRFKYSNHGFGLVGLAIATVTGEPYNDWVAREIVAPSGLGETQPDTPLPAGTPLASGHIARLLMGKSFTIPADTQTHALSAATGFVSTPDNLVRFFSSLDPAAKASVLSVESRREMTRRHWQVPDISAPRYYGLGTNQSTAGKWAWFGHGGGFPGVLSHTMMVPEAEIAVSVGTNSMDAEPSMLTESTLRIMQVFAEHGAPTKKTSGWTGRFWTMWGATDLVPMGDKVMLANPGLANPFLDATELTVTGPDSAHVSKATGFGNHGQSARLLRGPDGQIREAVVGGSALVPAAALAEEIHARAAAKRH